MGNVSRPERIWKWIEKGAPHECWIWRGRLDRHGYGRFKGLWTKSELAHRNLYWLVYGPFDVSLHVLHKCDNPRCVNPSHLFLGTHADNVRDMVAKGRNKLPFGGAGHQLHKNQPRAPDGRFLQSRRHP